MKLPPLDCVRCYMNPPMHAGKLCDSCHKEQEKPVYGWRKIKKEDIVRGTIVCFRNIHKDGGYGTATITQVIDNQVTFSRPMAYAHTEFNSNTGLLSQEVFSAFVSTLLKDTSDVEVFEESSGKIRSALT